jgi:putative phosphoribosyl transferase
MERTAVLEATSSNGAQGALAAPALRPELIGAIVACGGRPDLIDRPVLDDVRAPVLLIVGSLDPREVLASNRRALPQLARGELLMIPGATQPFAERGAEEMIVRLAGGFFSRHLHGSRSRKMTGS